MRILITGAASFLGRHLVGYFLSQGEEVLAVARKNARGLDKLLEMEYLSKGCFRLITMDIRDVEELKEGFDICIHLAWGGIGKSGRMDKDIQAENIENAKSVMRACKKNNAKKMIFAGSQAEYGQTLEDIEKKYGRDFDIADIPLQEEDACKAPKSEYGKAKLAVSEILSELGCELGIEYIHMRIFSVFGQGDHETSLISSCYRSFLKNEDVHIGDCVQAWNYMYVKDLCRAVHMLAGCELNTGSDRSHIINIAGSENKRLMEYVEEMKRLLKSSSRIITEKREAVSEGIPFLNPDTGRLGSLGFRELYGFEGGIKDMKKTAFS